MCFRYRLPDRKLLCETLIILKKTKSETIYEYRNGRRVQSSNGIELEDAEILRRHESVDELLEPRGVAAAPSDQ